MTQAEQHQLALECRASLANAAMMGDGVRLGVEVAFKHVAHAIQLETPSFDAREFFAECGIDALAH